MTKEKWLEHMENSTGTKRPSMGGSPDHWKQLVKDHIEHGCLECKERSRTRKHEMNRKAREEAYKSCGLVKVYGALGGTYWE